jgi:hypothetical protein
MAQTILVKTLRQVLQKFRGIGGTFKNVLTRENSTNVFYLKVLYR